MGSAYPTGEKLKSMVMLVMFAPRYATSGWVNLELQRCGFNLEKSISIAAEQCDDPECDAAHGTYFMQSVVSLPKQ